MPKNRTSVDYNMGKIEDSIMEAAIEQVKSVPKKILSGVVVRTPVKTGHLKGNWQVGIDYKPHGEVFRNDPSGSVVLSEGNSRIRTITKKTKNIYIVNNASYAADIENGDANRPPGTIVEATIRGLY